MAMLHLDVRPVGAAEGNSSVSSPASPPTWLYFSGVDLWRDGGSIHLGLQWAPNALERDGFTLKLLLAEGQYRYRSGSTDIRGTNATLAIMPGWKFKHAGAELTVFAGLDAQQHSLSPDDTSNQLRGNHLGVRGSLEFWWEPTQLTMVSLAASASTIGSNGWARAAFGWRVNDMLWAGPEIETSGNSVYQQYRAGAHVTGLRTGAFEWSAATGFMTDSDSRAGIYGRIGLLTRR